MGESKENSREKRLKKAAEKRKEMQKYNQIGPRIRKGDYKN